MKFDLRHGDSREVLAALADASVDALVTDPPAGIGFMGRAWDGAAAFREQMRPIFEECLRVLKPGAHGLVWALPRTSHWTATALEDAGFEIRDRVSHLFGTGFPKSLDVSKAIDKIAPRAGMFAGFAVHYAERRAASGLTHSEICAAAGAHGEHNHGGASVNWERGYGVPTEEQWRILRPLLGLGHEWSPLIERVEAERSVIGSAAATRLAVAPGQGEDRSPVTIDVTVPATLLAQQWEGWGTALKPACEDWWLVRRPLDGTVAANVAAHGTGPLNIDGCRIGYGNKALEDVRREAGSPTLRGGEPAFDGGMKTGAPIEFHPSGRWPANVTLDEEAAALLDEQSGELPAGVAVGGLGSASGSDAIYMRMQRREGAGDHGYADRGGASRFFYVAKPDRAERDIGCEDLAPASGGEATARVEGTAGLQNPRAGAGRNGGARNIHPTVKSVDLMRWLCRLITPRNGLVLDPFMGSGSTGVACSREGLRFIGIERERQYFEIAKRRLAGDAPLFNSAVLK